MVFRKWLELDVGCLGFLVGLVWVLGVGIVIWCCFEGYVVVLVSWWWCVEYCCLMWDVRICCCFCVWLGNEMIVLVICDVCFELVWCYEIVCCCRLVVYCLCCLDLWFWCVGVFDCGDWMFLLLICRIESCCFCIWCDLIIWCLVWNWCCWYVICLVVFCCCVGLLDSSNWIVSVYWLLGMELMVCWWGVIFVVGICDCVLCCWWIVSGLLLFVCVLRWFSCCLMYCFLVCGWFCVMCWLFCWKISCVGDILCLVYLSVYCVLVCCDSWDCWGCGGSVFCSCCVGMCWISVLVLLMCWVCCWCLCWWIVMFVVLVLFGWICV